MMDGSSRRLIKGRWIVALLSYVVGAVWLCLAPTLQAESGLSQAKSNSPRTTLVLGTAENFAPYAFRDADGHWLGIDVEIARHLFPDLEVKVVSYPRARLEMMTKYGEIDGLLSTSGFFNDNVNDFVVLSDAVYESEVSAFCLKIRAIPKPLEVFDDTAGYRLGVLNGYSYSLGGHSIESHARVMHVQRDQQLIDLLKFGRIDIAVSEDISFIYRARLSNEFDIIKPVIEVASRPVSIALNKSIVASEPQLLKRLNTAIAKAVEDESIDQIILSYLVPQMRPKPRPIE
ncbi:MAG: transporter substrate-binding domain-containing protein [Hahellaceae bacterium]|nr:transporter substrate-binding domain-containing protein [Hahellaceae bacterium]MCP5169172.1 transporter substrate-binding domain-containing protein [Hahellaceae bacterium]